MLAIVLAVAAVGGGCGGNDDGDAPSPEELKQLIPPAAELGPLELERSLTWDNAIDFIVQGFFLPEATAPSSAIEQVEDAGFAAGAGDVLRPRGGGPPVNVSVAAFDSEDGATEAQAYLHDQNLQQPCFAVCSVSPEEFSIDEIPEATAVHHVPLEDDLPPNAPPPFEAYTVVFTVGENLFYATVGGEPGDVPAADFERGAIALYEHANAESG